MLFETAPHQRKDVTVLSVVFRPHKVRTNKSMGLVNSHCSVLQTAQWSLVDCLCCLMSSLLFSLPCLSYPISHSCGFSCHSLICSHQHVGSVRTGGVKWRGQHTDLMPSIITALMFPLHSPEM